MKKRGDGKVVEVGAGDVGVEKAVVEEVGAEEEVGVGVEVAEAGEEVRLHRHNAYSNCLIETVRENDTYIILFHLRA